MDKRLIFLLAAFLSLLFLGRISLSPNIDHAPEEDNAAILLAYKNNTSNIIVNGSGIVVKKLKDDLKGSKHQKFIIELDKNHSLLISHNIDLAPRITALQKGDKVSFKGEYEWNKKGGIVHWTHRDPKGRHTNGWIKHNGTIYQ